MAAIERGKGFVLGGKVFPHPVFGEKTSTEGLLGFELLLLVNPLLSTPYEKQGLAGGRAAGEILVVRLP